MSMTVVVLLNAVLVAVASIGFAACYRELRVIRRGLGAFDEGQGRRTGSLITGLQALREPLGAIRAAVEELSPNRRDTVEQRVAPVHDASVSSKAEPTGLRLDLPRAGDEDRESDGETRLMRPPTAQELAAAGAVPPPTAASPAGGPSPAPLAAGLTALRRAGAPASGPPPHLPPVKRGQTVMGLPPPAAAPPLSTHRPPPPAAPGDSLRPVCKTCKGNGAVRGLDNGIADCKACGGSGYLDPTVRPEHEHAAGMDDTERPTTFIG